MTSPIRAIGAKLLIALLLTGAASLTTGAAAFADDPPGVVTGGASTVATSTATVTGTVDPRGSEVSDCHVEYGTDTSYSYNAPCSPSPGDGSGAVAISASLDALQPSTLYHFRVVATNAGGTTQGADATFTTAAPPVPVVVTGGVDHFDVERAFVNGTINANGLNTTCRVEYGLTTSYGYSAFCDSSVDGGTAPVAVHATLNGLVAGQTFHYRFVGTNDAGTSYGADQTLFTPAIVDSQKPSGDGSGGSGGSGSGSGGTRSGANGKLSLPGSVKVSGGRAKLRVSCSGAACRGTLRLSTRSGRRTVTLGSAPVSLRAGQKATVIVRLTAAGRAQLKRHRGGLSVRVSGAGASKTIKLRR